jgi:MFS family permease
MSLSMFVLVPLFVRALGGTETTIGTLVGAGALASVCCRPFAGGWLDRTSRRTALLWGQTINMLSFLPFLAIHALGPALYLALIAHWIVWGFLFAAYFTYAADLAPPSRRGEGLAIFGMWGILTNGLGPTLCEWLIGWGGFPWLFGVAAGFAGVSLALTLLVPFRAAPPGARGRSVLGDLRVLLRGAPGGPLRVFVVMALFGAGINAVWYFLALFGRTVGIDHVAPFFLAYAATSVCLRLFGRRLPDRLGPHRVAIPFLGVFALGQLVVCALPAPGAMLLAGVACGAGHGVLWPVLQALALARTSPAMAGAVVAVSTAALDVGGVVGNPVFGWVAETFGYRPMFTLAACCALAALSLMAIDPIRQRVT